MVDGTTDRNVDKQLVILAWVFVNKDVVTKFIHIRICNLSTAEDLFGAIDKVFM